MWVESTKPDSDTVPPLGLGSVTRNEAPRRQTGHGFQVRRAKLHLVDLAGAAHFARAEGRGHTIEQRYLKTVKTYENTHTHIYSHLYNIYI